jgi:hypothetical protein
MACFVPRGGSLSHSCHLKLCMCGKLFQILILLPFLHSPRRFCLRGYPTSLSRGRGTNYGRLNAGYYPFGPAGRPDFKARKTTENSL